MTRIEPNPERLPTKEDMALIDRVLKAKKYNLKAVYAEAFDPEESRAFESCLPELSLFCVFEKSEDWDVKKDRFKIGSDIERRVNRGEFGSRWWTYVTCHEQKRIAEEDFEARKISEGAVLVWPLDAYGTRTYELPPRKERPKGRHGKRAKAKAEAKA